MGPGRRAGAGRGLAPNLQDEASVPDSAVHVPSTSHCAFLSLMALRGHAKGPSIAEGLQQVDAEPGLQSWDNGRSRGAPHRS